MREGTRNFYKEVLGWDHEPPDYADSCVLYAMQSLSLENRIVLTLRFYFGLDAEQTAIALVCSAEEAQGRYQYAALMCKFLDSGNIFRLPPPIDKTDPTGSPVIISKATSLWDLEMPNSIRLPLIRAGIHALGQLSDMTRKKALSYRGMGEARVQALEAFMKRYGISFSKE